MLTKADILKHSHDYEKNKKAVLSTLKIKVHIKQNDWKWINNYEGEFSICLENTKNNVEIYLSEVLGWVFAVDPDTKLPFYNNHNYDYYKLIDICLTSLINNYYSCIENYYSSHIEGEMLNDDAKQLIKFIGNDVVLKQVLNEDYIRCKQFRHDAETNTLHIGINWKKLNSQIIFT